MAGKEEKKDKPSFFKSIVFRTWLGFIVIAFAMIAGLWITQGLLFDSIYQTAKRNNVTETCETLVNDFAAAFEGDYEAYENTLSERSVEQSMAAFIFYLSDFGQAETGDRDVNVISYSVSYIGQYSGIDLETGEGGVVLTISDDYFDRLKSRETDSAVFFETKYDGRKIMVYGDTVTLAGSNVQGTAFGEREIYFYFATSLTPSPLAGEVITNQLIFMSCICVALGVVLAFIIVKLITKPISLFAATAQRLGGGDYSVRFDGYGYTEYNELAKALNLSTQEMSKTERLRRDLLANVSHDLRTPLTMIKAYAELIRDISGRDEKKRTDHSQVIIDEVDRLSGLVGDILDLSKLQSGTETLNLTRNDLSAIVRTAVKRFEFFAVKKGYRIHCDCGEGFTVLCDEKKMNQVIYNLVGNAINYTGADRSVKISVTLEDGRIVFRVTDSGKGIPLDEIDAVWDKYYRASSGRRKVVGSGLGLSIVKSILTEHGARFGVESELCCGSTFWFSLPEVSALSLGNER